MTIADRAREIATRAHAGQLRRDGITPYIRHPERVAARVAGDDEAQAVAWLHDVLEDSEETEETLVSSGISIGVVEAVKLLTKRTGGSYEDYLHAIRENKLACKVKLNDMLDNLSDSPTEHQIVKYAKGILLLCDMSPESFPGNANKQGA